MVYCVLFTITLRDAAQAPALLKSLETLRQYCQLYEPGTLTYELLQDETNNNKEEAEIPLRYAVLERYASRDDFTQVHQRSSAFSEFTEALQSLQPAETCLTLLSELKREPLEVKEIKELSLVSRQEKGVLVFCGSRNGSNPLFLTEAEALGEFLACTRRQPLIYGGGNVGLMGAVAKATKEHGGKVISVMPQALAAREVRGEVPGDIIYITHTMSERKSIMFAHATAVVVLPGGLGTFDELLEVMTLSQLNSYRPSIGIINVGGFFDPFLEYLKYMAKEGFVDAECASGFVVRPTAVEVMKELATFVPPPPTYPLKWQTRP